MVLLTGSDGDGFSGIGNMNSLLNLFSNNAIFYYKRMIKKTLL